MKNMLAKSIRLTDDMMRTIQFVAATEHVEDAVAIRKLIQTGAETYVARLYEQGRITLREAAARLGTDLTGALDLMMEHGVRGNLQAADVLASVDQMS